MMVLTPVWKKLCVFVCVWHLLVFADKRYFTPTVSNCWKAAKGHFRAFYSFLSALWIWVVSYDHQQNIDCYCFLKCVIALDQSHRLLRSCFKEHLKQSIPFVSYLIDSVWLFISLGPLIKDLSVFLTQWHSASPKLDCCSNTVEI